MAVLGTESEGCILKALHDSVDAKMDCLFAENSVVVLNLLAAKAMYIVPKIMDAGYLAIGKKKLAFTRHQQ